MLTSLFRKSTPLNYSLIVLGTAATFAIYQIHHAVGESTLISFGEKFLLFAVILFSMFIANFIVKKNGLSRDSSYSILFFWMLLMFFPDVLGLPNLILSAFFILLSLRRLISLHSLKAAREKIFDASMWIFVATLFHFWAVVFIALVFISILFHVSRDYRNWLLPFVALFAVATAFGLFALVFDASLISEFPNKITADFSINYLKTQTQQIAIGAFAVFALFFVVSMVFTLASRPMVLQASYKKVIASFFIGLFIFLASPDKSNELLIFTFAPVAFMATSHVEFGHHQLRQEITIALFMLSAFTLFFMQL